MLARKIYLGKNTDVSQLPIEMKRYVGSVLNNIPTYLKNELRTTYADMKSAVIDPSNYQSEFLRRFNAMENQVGSAEERLMIEAYYLVGIDSYEFWMPTSEGGLGGYDQFKVFKSYDGFDDYDLPSMNDNDWPNEAPFLKRGHLTFSER